MRKYTSSHLYQQIRDDFKAGKFQYGERITEIGLSERYDTSRTPLREALIQLEKDGLVERNPNGRIHILHITEDNLKEILDLRLFLEILTLEHAIKEEHKEAFLDDLRANIILVDDLLDHGLKEKARVELANFHLIAHKHANLRYTQQIIANYNFLIYPLRSKVLLERERLIMAQREHKEILKLLEDGQMEALRAHYKKHIYIAVDNMVSELKKLLAQ